MNTRKLYITGRGMVSPAGCEIEEMWPHLKAGNVLYDSLELSGNLPCKIGGKVKEFNALTYIPKRIVNKTDIFSQFFLASVAMAIKESGLNISENNAFDIGIFYGNNSGGWNICERGFYELFQESYEMVNPWQATAWFPTASQGYASIIYGIKGYSKTFVADRVSSAAALYHGLQSICNKRNHKIIVGGSEAPLTALGTICYNESGCITNKREKSACKPFIENSQGIILSEGGAAITIETAEELGSVPIAEIVGFATNINTNEQIFGIGECMKMALKDAKMSIDDIDLIIPEGNGDWKSDCLEREAILNTFGKRKNQLPIFFTKYLLGHLYGGALIADIISATLVLAHNDIPKYRFIDELECLFTDKLNKSVENVLVNSRTTAGVNYSFIISKVKKEEVQ